ncbi:4'-phosphopantetheinyl transferase family protein [Nesterenkonia sandarakina]|uniref:Phosphopantetheinyl transferase (Holo-ACP synthase) n=1 Tax=Nesterenkonia sandarakina TaxID=272918 RepID=A0A7Z0E7N9_9MICC|nr:4'-phosphopantetheinyl transferase superfamily protein [Nesterenkonia sandarakina]NYJ16593.1 phosphopantetheinyl transferase (holo-ACP synthase) [Nesterenkonia sandarakina]
MEWTYSSGGSADSIVLALVAEAHGVDPARVELVPRRGAPEARVAGKRVEVSRSRSHGWIAAACAGPGEASSLGIDIELIDPFLRSTTQPAGFAEVILAPEESPWFRLTEGLDDADRLYWLLRTWVRKEAVLKSLHIGFDVGRGGLHPTAVVLNEPWEPPLCLSHPAVTLTDLPRSSHSARDAREGLPVMLALAENSGPLLDPRR